jgi:glutathione synthase/RimK-type ligase-like ATP-grasp enzyme
VSRVAVATCAGVDVDSDSPRLLDALAREGLEARLCVWDDASVDWDGFDLVVVRSTWDYTSRREQFLSWARGIRRIDNPVSVLEYSSDKHYLADLAARGHQIVPSSFVDVGEQPVFPEGDFVVKPCVGAGSRDAARYRADQHDEARRHVTRLHDEGRDALVQPYVASVDEVGERALVFIDGSFSHAMTKGAMLNTDQLDRNLLYRMEQMSLAEPEPDAVSFASEVLANGGHGHLLYARVDLVRTEAGWAVMELELVEPSLFLGWDEAAAPRLARAIAGRLA